MFLAIKSEMDSRPFLYQLMRCLQNYGSILVLTNNRTLNRLIIDEDEGGFRNIAVLVDDAESADEICSAYGVQQEDYDFVLLDNLGASEFDACFLLVGQKVSPEFDDEVELILEDKSMRSCLIQFGVAQGKSTNKNMKQKETAAERKERQAREKGERAEKQKAEREAKQKKTRKNGDVPADYDPAAKFHEMVEHESLRKKKAVVVPFLSMQEIETMEAEHIFPEVNRTLSEAIFDLLSPELSVEKSEYRKEVRVKDESSGDISSRDAVR